MTSGLTPINFEKNQSYIFSAANPITLGKEECGFIVKDDNHVIVQKLKIQPSPYSPTYVSFCNDNPGQVAALKLVKDKKFQLNKNDMFYLANMNYVFVVSDLNELIRSK